MSFEFKNLKKELYESALITAGATAIGFASRKATGDSLGTPGSFKGALKLAVAVGLGTVGVKCAQAKGWIPTDPTM